MLDGNLPEQELGERITIATRQLAKRQMTWLRSMPAREVLPAQGDDAANLAQLQRLLSLHP